MRRLRKSENPFPEAMSEPGSLVVGFLEVVPEQPDLEMLKGTSSFIGSRCLPTMLTPRNSVIQVFIEVGLSVAGMWHP